MFRELMTPTHHTFYKKIWLNRITRFSRFHIQRTDRFSLICNSALTNLSCRAVS